MKQLMISGLLTLALVGCASSQTQKQDDAPIAEDASAAEAAAPAEKPVAETEVSTEATTATAGLPAEADGRIQMDKSLIRFDDGDSLGYDTIEIRILGLDTPEIIHEDHGIFEDQPRGREAAAFTQNLIEKAEVVEYLPADTDPYGRSLSHLFVDGELLSIKVIQAGLAYENVSRYGDNGTPELAAMILEAVKDLPQPNFQDPHDWRRANQKRD